MIMDIATGQQFKFWIKALDGLAFGVTLFVYRYRLSDDFHFGEGMELLAIVIESTLGTVIIASLSVSCCIVTDSDNDPQ